MSLFKKKPQLVPKKKKHFLRLLLEAALIALIIRSFVFEAFTIPTGSMKNTLLVGDFLMVSKFMYTIKSPKYIPFTAIRLPYFELPGFTTPDRGDIVVFEFPGDRDELVPKTPMNYIKRCVGIPGDEIEVRDKQLYVNGEPYPNPPESKYMNRALPKGYPELEIFPRGSNFNHDNYGPVHIPKKEDEITITRDNFQAWNVFIRREGHVPSIGADGLLRIDGVLKSTYTVERDYLFMMGDNRDNSLDSRYWGFMPMDHVVGEAFMIYWSWYKNPTPGEEGFDPEEKPSFRIRFERLFNFPR